MGTVGINDLQKKAPLEMISSVRFAMNGNQLHQLQTLGWFHYVLGLSSMQNPEPLQKCCHYFVLDLGGAIGNGKQYWPWIAWQDACNVIFEALHQDWQGPINAVAPEQVTCKEFVRTLGRVMNKPSFMKVPAFALRTIIGEGSCALTGSQRVTPGVLLEQCFQFEYPTLKECLVTNLLTLKKER